jgi:hypothetical protein
MDHFVVMYDTKNGITIEDALNSSLYAFAKVM